MRNLASLLWAGNDDLRSEGVAAMKLKVSRATDAGDLDSSESSDATEVDSVISGFSYSKYDDEDYYERWKDLIQFSGTNASWAEKKLPLTKISQLMRDFENVHLSPCGIWCELVRYGELVKTRRWNAF